MQQITENDQLILKALIKYKKIKRKELLKLVEINPTSFHNSMTRLIFNNMVTIKEEKKKGAPHIVTITKNGLTFGKML